MKHFIHFAVDELTNLCLKISACFPCSPYVGFIWENQAIDYNNQGDMNRNRIYTSPDTARQVSATFLKCMVIVNCYFK